MNENKISRRDFLKIAGFAIASTTLNGCKPSGSNGPDDVPTDKMTYRFFPEHGDKVSLLGYGMMRLPAGKARRTRSTYRPGCCE